MCCMFRLSPFHARDLTLLIESDGSINGPFSLYLNERFDNPHTREAAAAGLRVFHRFLVAHGIDLPCRALEGESLRSVERKWLTELAYRPLEEVEEMSDAMIKRLTTVRKAAVARDRIGAVSPNTAAIKLASVAAFLRWFFTDVLAEAIRSASDRRALSDSYTATCADLEARIRGTKQGHHHEIRSLPVERYLRLVRELVLHPEKLFVTQGGKQSATLMRDRAMVLLAAEGLRPGSLGNLAIDNFKYEAGSAGGYVEIKDNVPRRQAPVRTNTPKAKGARSTFVPYASNVTVKLWPFTCLAIKQYIDGERVEVLGRHLKNRSKSFLFVADHGGPITDRTTIAVVFCRLESRLRELGLLTRAAGDPYARGAHYDFSAYTLRHSAATFFYKSNAHRPAVMDLMRQRFGWSASSKMPDRYANRAMSEEASVDMSDFHDQLLNALAAKRQDR